MYAWQILELHSLLQDAPDPVHVAPIRFWVSGIGFHTDGLMGGLTADVGSPVDTVMRPLGRRMTAGAAGHAAVGGHAGAAGAGSHARHGVCHVDVDNNVWLGCSRWCCHWLWGPCCSRCDQ